MKKLAVEPMVTSEYNEWWSKRVNDNILRSRKEDVRSIEEYLQVVSSEIEIIRQDFEKRNLELGKKIEQLEEEKMQLGLDVDIQKSIRTAGLGKTSEQWRQEIQEKKIKADQWEKKFQDTRAREASLGKIEELKEQVGELEDALQNSELRIEILEKSNEQWQEQFHPSQDQIRERDYIMGEAVAQVREVADHLQTLAVQADVLSLKYESELDRGQ
ncbi:hypothetical protein Goshw_015572 [Gossypium schwendimanii]|uniref:Uncharacterized protein n=1 Tax=Gossypium schwendimanii TaxID=34291 RepID=A0A7J9N6N4_GOSSC|nr:hypothetical protein [Gossypium schwendimanii]